MSPSMSRALSATSPVSVDFGRPNWVRSLRASDVPSELATYEPGSHWLLASIDRELRPEEPAVDYGAAAMWLEVGVEGASRTLLPGVFDQFLRIGAGPFEARELARERAVEFVEEVGPLGIYEPCLTEKGLVVYEPCTAMVNMSRAFGLAMREAETNPEEFDLETGPFLALSADRYAVGLSRRFGAWQLRADTILAAMVFYFWVAIDSASFEICSACGIVFSPRRRLRAGDDAYCLASPCRKERKAASKRRIGAGVRRRGSTRQRRL